jgi:hypothetical protein
MKSTAACFVSQFAGRFVLVAIAWLWSNSALAFPENIRHGYVNCTSCHVSPSGGGTLTPYGRSLSSELMSTWSYKDEEGILSGLVKPEDIPEFLMVGGDARGVQTWSSTPNVDQAKWIPMQAELEAAVRVGRFTVDSTFGRVYTYDTANDYWGSHRYFAMLNATDELTVRVGRFYPEYGLMVPDHYVATRRYLGFDEGQERNNAEVAYNGEKWSAFLTESQSPGEIAESSRETATVAQVNRNFYESSKIGASVWNSHSDIEDRQMYGIHGMLGFNKRTFLLSEFDSQTVMPSGGATTRGFYAFNRFGYELYKGVIVFAQQDYAQSDVANGSTEIENYGPGFNFFPRPHFEFSALWEKQRVRSSGMGFTDYAYLLFHYYL